MTFLSCGLPGGLPPWRPLYYLSPIDFFCWWCKRALPLARAMDSLAKLIYDLHGKYLHTYRTWLCVPVCKNVLPLTAWDDTTGRPTTRTRIDSWLGESIYLYWADWPCSDIYATFLPFVVVVGQMTELEAVPRIKDNNDTLTTATFDTCSAWWERGPRPW